MYRINKEVGVNIIVGLWVFFFFLYCRFICVIFWKCLFYSVIFFIFMFIYFRYIIYFMMKSSNIDSIGGDVMDRVRVESRILVM